LEPNKEQTWEKYGSQELGVVLYRFYVQLPPTKGQKGIPNSTEKAKCSLTKPTSKASPSKQGITIKEFINKANRKGITIKARHHHQIQKNSSHQGKNSLTTWPNKAKRPNTAKRRKCRQLLSKGKRQSHQSHSCRLLQMQRKKFYHACSKVKSERHKASKALQTKHSINIKQIPLPLQTKQSINKTQSKADSSSTPDRAFNQQDIKLIKQIPHA